MLPPVWPCQSADLHLVSRPFGSPFLRALPKDAVVAQLVRAPVCGTGGRWFEPTQLYHFSMIRPVLRLVSLSATRSLLLDADASRTASSRLRGLAPCATPSHDPSLPSADASVLIACCGRPRPASRGVQPSSSAARAVFFAIGSWSSCGDASG